jgi:KRAB domain-containing zinc finger protein
MESSNIKQEPSVEFVLILPAREVKKVEVKREIIGKVDDKFKCKVCDKTFETKKKLKDHQRVHKPKVKCSICLEMVLPTHLKRHMQTHDPNRERNFECKNCSKAFATKDHLTKHFKTHEKSFICQECGEKFAENYQLEAHKLNHVNNKPFKCDLCPKAFSCKNSLVTHMKENHFSDSKIFNCKNCSYETKSSMAFNGHKRTHNKLFKCSKCAKKIPTSTDLKQHMAKHDDVKAFKCNQCDYAGKKDKYLSKHQKKYHSLNKIISTH